MGSKTGEIGFELSVPFSIDPYMSTEFLTLLPRHLSTGSAVRNGVASDLNWAPSGIPNGLFFASISGRLLDFMVAIAH
jgi:hypothetical protein